MGILTHFSFVVHGGFTAGAVWAQPTVAVGRTRFRCGASGAAAARPVSVPQRRARRLLARAVAAGDDSGAGPHDRDCP